MIWLTSLGKRWPFWETNMNRRSSSWEQRLENRERLETKRNNRFGKRWVSWIRASTNYSRRYSLKSKRITHSNFRSPDSNPQFPPLKMISPLSSQISRRCSPPTIILWNNWVRRGTGTQIYATKSSSWNSRLRKVKVTSFRWSRKTEIWN
jgi:hypothetical protein